MGKKLGIWILRVFLGLTLLLALFVLLFVFGRTFMPPERLIAVQKDQMTEQCNLKPGDKIYSDDFLWDSEYYVEYTTGDFRLVARRSLLGELLCFPGIGYLTKPVYTPECYGICVTGRDGVRRVSNHACLAKLGISS